jgi:microcystin-dependent protein
MISGDAVTLSVGFRAIGVTHTQLAEHGHCGQLLVGSPINGGDEFRDPGFGVLKLDHVQAAKPLHYHCASAWRVIPTGLLDTDEIYEVSYNSSAGAYRLLGLKNRTGVVEPFAGTTAPAGSLLCYGQAVSRTDYVGLFTVIGTTYGTGDGSTTFNVPDLRGAVAGGKSNMGGVDRGNLTGGATLGAAFGSQSQVAITNSLGTPTTGGPSDTQTVQAGSGVAVASINHNHSANVSVNGTSGAFSIVQPTIVLNYVIKT